MLDLRFVERLSHDSREATVKVLQFRTKTEHVDSATTTPEPLAWTDWKDVPLVKET